MDQELTAKCQLLADNYRVVSKSAKLDMAEAAALAALMFTNADATAVEDVIRANRKLLKENVGMFGNLRGNMSITLLAKMSIAEDPKAYLDKVIKAYDAIRAGRKFEDEALVNAAICLADNAEPADYERIAERAYAIKKQMKAAHPLLTDDSDLTMAVILTIFGLDIDATMAQADACYEALKSDGFLFMKDQLQSISMILALTEGPLEEKCARFNELREALKEAGAKMKGESLPIIAALVGLEGDANGIAHEVDDAEEFLKHQKGFGAMGVGAKLRRIFAAALVLQVHLGDGEQLRTAQAVSGAITQEIVSNIIMLIILIEINMLIASSQS